MLVEHGPNVTRFCSSKGLLGSKTIELAAGIHHNRGITSPVIRTGSEHRRYWSGATIMNVRQSSRQGTSVTARPGSACGAPGVIRYLMIGFLLLCPGGLVAQTESAPAPDAEPADTTEPLDESDPVAPTKEEEPAEQEEPVAPTDEDQPVAATEQEEPVAPTEEVPDTKSEKETKPEEEEEKDVSLRPRIELYTPSVSHLIQRTRESHLGGLMSHASGLFTAGMSGGRGMGSEQWGALCQVLAAQSDTSVGIATYAPTTEGRPRFSIAFDWTLSDVVGLIEKIIALPGMDEVFEGVRVVRGENGVHELYASDVPMAFLLSNGDGGSRIVSDLDIEETPSLYGEDLANDGPPKATDTVLYSRFNLVGTEKDSGALFGTEIPWLQSIRYQASVRSGGEWSERIAVNWNALVGAGAKTALKRAKQRFFVPRDAFGAIVVSSPLLQGMLDVFAGLKPGVLIGELGGLSGNRIGPELCFVLLPGTGILPIPDIVIQTRVRYASSVINDIRKAIEKANGERAEKDLPATWHEIEIDGKTVFVHDGRSDASSGFGPATFRRALFTDERTDPKGNKRTFLNVVLTSTDIRSMVRRWTKPLRKDERVVIPSKSKVDAQGWIHWTQLYDHLHPWLNLGIAGLEPGAVLPATERVESYLSDATLTVRAKYTGLMIRHIGPIPIGTIYLPLIVSSSLSADESGSTDLSRERIASDRLKLFYKNAKLFRKDVGRWPARVAELDGYIDFTGQPWLLKLRRSSRAALREGFFNLLTGDDDSDEDEDEGDSQIDDEMFVVDWGEEEWTLGIRKGTLDHLERLYIDQDGTIHRVPSAPSEEAGDDAKPDRKATETEAI